MDMRDVRSPVPASCCYRAMAGSAVRWTCACPVCRPLRRFAPAGRTARSAARWPAIRSPAPQRLRCTCGVLCARLNPDGSLFADLIERVVAGENVANRCGIQSGTRCFRPCWVLHPGAPDAPERSTLMHSRPANKHHGGDDEPIVLRPRDGDRDPRPSLAEAPAPRPRLPGARANQRAWTCARCDVETGYSIATPRGTRLLHRSSRRETPPGTVGYTDHERC